MSAKVDNADVAVPEASPESNEKQEVQKDAPRSRRNLWIGLGVLLAVIITVAIAVPLSLKNKDDKKDAAKTDAPETANVSQMSNAASQCFEPKEGDDCTTQESYQQCLDLVNSGCQKIYSTFSCPPQHRCGDEPEAPLVACTMELAYCADGTAVGRSGQNCHFEACPDGGCPTDTYHCNDGTVLARDPSIGCDFQACPDPLLAATGSQESSTQQQKCTRELAYCGDGTPVGRAPPSCHFEACPDGACPIDTYHCDDGTVLARDPALGCEFEACPEPVQLPANEEDEVVCTMDVKECPDGSFVSREAPNCDFAPCPETPALSACTMELRYCADGTAVGRSGSNCHFEPCPDGGCPTDTYHCDDGTVLSRDPAIGCEFEACPEPVQLPANTEDEIMCTMDVKECPDGSFVSREAPNCEFAACPEPPAIAACTMELAYCADGTAVGRTAPFCHFEPCPDGGCPTDSYHCDDGTVLARDKALGCEFEACPEPAQLPAAAATSSQGASTQQLMCSRELAYCGDGTPVGRAPPSCHFEACPDGACPIDTYTCNDGTELLRDPSIGCEFQACPDPLPAAADQCQPPEEGYDCETEESYQECLAVAFSGCQTILSGYSCPPVYFCGDETEQPAVVACTLDLGICADGSSVGRTAPNCDFELCPDGSCTIDTFACPDGSEVSRDKNNNCQFSVCP